MSCDTGQWIPCFERCQLAMTWMSNIKDVRYGGISMTKFNDQYLK